MTLVLSLELVKIYRVLFPLVDALRIVFELAEGHIYPALRRWLRPPAVRGLSPLSWAALIFESAVAGQLRPHSKILGDAPPF